MEERLKLQFINLNTMKFLAELVCSQNLIVFFR